MTGDFSQPMEIEEALAALAVLGRADTMGLAALLDREGTSEYGITVLAKSLSELSSHPAFHHCLNLED